MPHSKRPEPAFSDIGISLTRAMHSYWVSILITDGDRLVVWRTSFSSKSHAWHDLLRPHWWSSTILRQLGAIVPSTNDSAPHDNHYGKNVAYAAEIWTLQTALERLSYFHPDHWIPELSLNAPHRKV